jgi:hypothetical protein
MFWCTGARDWSMMPPMRCAVVASLLFFAAFGSGCGPKFYPPVIVGLKYAPMTVPIGVTTTINGTVDFTDVQGDVTAIVLGVVDQTGNLVELTPESTGTQGLTVGTVNFGDPITPTGPGNEQISVRLLNIAGLSSDPVFGTIMVTAPPDAGSSPDTD